MEPVNSGVPKLTLLLLLITPVILLQLGLMAFALVDLARRKRVKGGSKLVWGLLIVLVSMLGPILYLILGREEEPVA